MVPRIIMRTLCPITLVTLMLVQAGIASAQPKIDLVPVAGPLNRPVCITNAGDDRLFIVEQRGRIRIVDGNGILLTRPFLDISDSLTAGNEQGLLGLAFHPDYATNGRFFIDYTNTSGNTVIAGYTVSQEDRDSADAASWVSLLTIAQPYTNHNGGALQFGPDGYLYISTGDGGSAGDPQRHAQDSLSLLGKILRIDVDGGSPYAVPETNPFVNTADARDEIWVLGLRNPWRFSFDRATGDLWIGDVGQSAWEEIDLQPASSAGGENYGWNCYEGNHAFKQSGCGDISTYVFPVYEYSHLATGGCSVTGGYIYRGSEFPGMSGYYFFSDYCADILWSLHDSSGIRVLRNEGQFSGNSFSTFGEDSAGGLYIAGITGRTVYKLVDTASYPADTSYTVWDTSFSVIDSSYFISDTTFTISHIDCTIADTVLSTRDSVYTVSDTSFVVADTVYLVTDTTYTVFDTACIVSDSSCVLTDTTWTLVDTTWTLRERSYVLVDTFFTIGDTSFTVSDTSLMVSDTVFTVRDSSYIPEATPMALKDTSCSSEESIFSRRDTSFVISDTSSTGTMFFSGPPKGIRIYPNPATDYLEISTNSPSDTPKPYRILDLQGRQVSGGLLTGTRSRIPLNFLKPGTYILEIRSAGGQGKVLFIKN